MRSFILILCIILSIPHFAGGQTFARQTTAAGLDAVSHSNGVAVADYDRDGDLDIFFAAHKAFHADSAETWDQLMQNQGDGTFLDVTEASGIINQNGLIDTKLGHKFGASWGDFNGDDYPDIFLTNAGPDILYQNQGDGTFLDITAAAGLDGDSTMASSSSLWWDYDLDGDLDLYICNYRQGRNKLFENQSGSESGQVTFSDVTLASRLGDTGKTWSAIPFDVNEDGMPDLYVVNDFGENALYVNEGNKTFRDMTDQYGLQDAGNGMGVTLGDYDNDGTFEIYLTNITGYSYNDTNPFFTRGPNQAFVNIALELGVADTDWGWGTTFFDADHDGDLDLYAAAGCYLVPGPYPNYFFENALNSDLAFIDRSQASGTNSSAEGRGLVAFDYDNDGDLDLLSANYQGPPDLYENRSQVQNWLKVELYGDHSNRNGIGAIVQVTAGQETYLRQNDGVEFLGQSIKPLHFGVADAQIAAQISVMWPDGAETVVEDVPVNQQITIEKNPITGLSEKAIQNPQRFRLLSNYPNPFNGNTNLRFETGDAGIVEIRITNILGQQIYQSSFQAGAGGVHLFNWNATDQEGRVLESGMYLYRISFRGTAKTAKMLYLK